MTAPVAQTIRPYNHQRQPAIPESLKQWLDTELTNLQNTLKDITAAIMQLQTFTAV